MFGRLILTKLSDGETVTGTVDSVTDGEATVLVTANADFGGKGEK